MKRLFSWLRNKANPREIRLLSGTAALAVVSWNGCKKIPPGHVGLVEDWNGRLKPYVFEPEMMCLFIPFYQHCVSLRTIPVKKKLTRVFYTKDGKAIGVFLQAKLEPKAHYAREIYMRFGRDYGRGFVDEEASVDIRSVVSNFESSDLLNSDESAMKAEEEICSRIVDACAFHRMILHEATVIFRDPQSVADDDRDDGGGGTD